MILSAATAWLILRVRFKLHHDDDLVFQTTGSGDLREVISLQFTVLALQNK